MNYGMKSKSGANIERVNEGNKSREKKSGSRSRQETKVDREREKSVR